MFLKKYYILISIILLIGSFTPVFADSFEDAVDAVNRRDFETAYKMVVPLAEKGQAAAQLMLGMMYFKGTGVEKNIIEADKWLFVAEKLGQDAGKKNRIYVERQMTREQIEKARKLGNEWLNNHKNVNPS
ncbi:MAG: hypothetical protein VW455_01895 [Nitrospinota bacterium]